MCNTSCCNLQNIIYSQNSINLASFTCPLVANLKLSTPLTEDLTSSIWLSQFCQSSNCAVSLYWFSILSTCFLNDTSVSRSQYKQDATFFPQIYFTLLYSTICKKRDRKIIYIKVPWHPLLLVGIR